MIVDDDYSLLLIGHGVANREVNSLLHSVSTVQCANRWNVPNVAI